MRERRMNTAPQCYSDFFDVAASRAGLRIRNDEVDGSIPTSSTNSSNNLARLKYRYTIYSTCFTVPAFIPASEIDCGNKHLSERLQFMDAFVGSMQMVAALAGVLVQFLTGRLLARRRPWVFTSGLRVIVTDRDPSAIGLGAAPDPT